MQKAISIRQPWAWLIVNGYKDIENREWRTSKRGRVLIHASSKMTQGDYDACALFVAGLDLPEGFTLPLPSALPKGGLVGEVEIVDCIERSDSQWFCGRFGWVLQDANAMPFVPCKGRLGFFRPEVLC